MVQEVVVVKLGEALGERDDIQHDMELGVGESGGLDVECTG
jgi:hypothetical protein